MNALKGIKLIVTDMDGTLLSNNQTIHPKDIEILQTLSKQGFIIVIASGRIFSMLETYYHTLDCVDYVISSNGAAIDEIRMKKTIYQSIIEDEMVYKVLDFCLKHKIECNLLSREACYFPKDSIRKERFVIYNDLASLNHLERIQIRGYESLKPVDNHIEKMLVYESNLEKRNLVKSFIESETNLAYTVSDHHLIDISNQDISKGNALQRLMFHLNIRPQEVLAFGDFDNDISLFQHARIKVAMGNAVDALKAQATHITRTNQQQGVAFALNNLLMEDQTMRFEKVVLDEFYRAYAVGHVTIDQELHLIVASEAIDGKCIMYSGKHFEKRTTLWNDQGGTMSIVPIPNTNGEFLAVRNFFPGFNASTAKVVHVKKENGTFVVNDFIYLPYLHRFDLITVGDTHYFIGATLCSSKKEREDWSDPGKVFVGVLPKDLSQGMTVTPILENLTHNHGYYAAPYEGKDAAWITSDEGLFVFIPPQKPGDNWTHHHLIEKPISDVAVLDIDFDGIPEIISIEPFHGNLMVMYKKINGTYQHVYTVERPLEFAHALCGTTLRGKPAFVCGIRRLNKEMFYIDYNLETKAYELHEIDREIGPANLTVINLEHEDIILSANNTIHQAAIYYVKK